MKARYILRSKINKNPEREMYENTRDMKIYTSRNVDHNIVTDRAARNSAICCYLIQTNWVK